MSVERAPPTELGTDAIAILDGRTFMFSDAHGDVPPGSVGGLLHEDTRFVSRWELRLAGRPLSDFSREELARHSEVLDEEFYDVLSQRSWLESKVSEGGTSLARVREQLSHARAELEGQPA